MLRFLIFTSLLFASLIMATDNSKKEVILLHTNDIESVYEPIPALWRDDMDFIGGISHLDTLIRNTREEEAITFTVDDGDILEMDLADPASVTRFVNEFQDSETSLDILINNAAVMACPQMPTKEGWDLQFAVNHIGHFILTKGLLSVMAKSPEARIVTLSSTGHKLSGIQWEDIHFEESYDKWKAYGQSKTAASLLAVEIANKMKDEGIKTYSVHPGGIFTPLQRHLEKEEMIALGWLGEDGELSEMAAANFKSPTQGATTSLWCATSPMLDDVSGVYCENCDVAVRQEDGPMARYVGVADWAVDTDEASKLWELTEHTLSSLS